MNIGTLIQFLLGSFLPWRSVALINFCFPIASLILLFFVPETPIWLISKNRLEEARKSIAWLRGWVEVEEIEDDFQELYKQIKSTKSEKPLSCSEKLKLFKDRTFLWPFFVVALTFFLSHFNGTTTLGIYAIKIFSVLKAPINTYYATVIMGVVQFIGCIICMVLINILGKRKLNFISLFGTAVCFVVVATHAYMYDIFYFGTTTTNLNSTLTNVTNSTIKDTTDESYHWLPLCFLVAASFLTHIGIRILPWVLTGEVYTTEIRAAASGFSGGIGYIFNFISNKIFLSLVAFLTLPGVFWFYGLLGMIGIVALYFVLPETEGKSLYEVTEHFAGRSKLRNSVGKRKRFENGNVNPAFVCDEKGISDTTL